MIWQQHVIPFAAIVIAICGLLYTIKSKAAESYVNTLEYKLNEVIEREKLCNERLNRVETLNTDLLLRLAGIRPMGRLDNERSS